MNKFQKEIDESVNRIANKRGINPNDLMYIAFAWDTGYIVIEQSAFNKMKKSKKDKLLEPMMTRKG